MTHFAPIPDKPGIVARWIAMVLTVKQCLQALLMLMLVVVAPTVLLGILSALWGPQIAAGCLLIYALLVCAAIWYYDIGA